MTVSLFTPRTCYVRAAIISLLQSKCCVFMPATMYIITFKSITQPGKKKLHARKKRVFTRNDAYPCMPWGGIYMYIVWLFIVIAGAFAKSACVIYQLSASTKTLPLHNSSGLNWLYLWHNTHNVDVGGIYRPQATFPETTRAQASLFPVRRSFFTGNKRRPCHRYDIVTGAKHRRVLDTPLLVTLNVDLVIDSVWFLTVNTDPVSDTLLLLTANIDLVIDAKWFMMVNYDRVIDTPLLLIQYCW